MLSGEKGTDRREVLTMNYFFYNLACESASIAGKHIQPLWIYSQWRHETANFLSPLCLETYNLAGLCQKMPNDYPQPDGDLYYMCFSSYLECAQYFGRYLQLYEEDGIFDAYTLYDYCKALKKGGYYGDSLENYYKGCAFYETP